MRSYSQLVLIVLFLFATVLFSDGSFFAQEVTVSSEMPESENHLIGTWKNKIISYRLTTLTIVDTTFQNTKRQFVEVGPEIEKAKKVGNITYFIHDQFLYEIYFVMPTLKDLASATGYNVIVKRDIETMKIVTQKVMNQLFGQVKFVKTCEKGFYICFGDSFMMYNGVEMKNFQNVSQTEAIIPRKVHAFSYNLEEFWSMELDEYFSRDSYMNTISFDEDDYMLIPTFKEKTVNEEGDITNNARILFKVANLKQEVAKINLKVEELNDYKVNALKIKYNPSSKMICGILMISEPSKTNPLIMTKWGYAYVEWKEDGTFIKSDITWLNKEDLLNQSMREYLISENIDPEEVSRFSLDSNIGYFEILDNGDILYIVNSIFPRMYEKLVNTKFILCISNKGTLKWTRTIPYSDNAFYKKAFYFLNEDQLHIFTREFTQNFKSGSYVFQDTKAPLNGEKMLMSDRIIDLNTGEIISHKPIFEGSLGKYEPYWNIREESKGKFVIRYRNTKGNAEKWVTLKF